MSVNVPPDLKYTKSHEWLRSEGNTVTIGITDHAQHELTDVVFVELPAVGRKLNAGESCAVVESVKTASDIYAPISGEVVEVNGELAGHPELVNKEPYSGGWFMKIRSSQPAELERLMTAENYTKQIDGSTI
ncbi:MAG TPA: glycine cleavage system protein GcvH [Verrucomicrobiae bacterium]|jgi:glycine cleavage system H protein|nr:glycine cleavage system protein GcvH [Verrucomicrobiae bacterium]